MSPTSGDDAYEKCQNVESHNSPPNGMERSTPDNGSRRNKGRVVIRGNKLIGAATQCAGASDAVAIVRLNGVSV